jgi:hypothetical protein
MYSLNDPIQCEGRIGRVFSYSNNGTINVLVRINENTWKVENWYLLMCSPYTGYLWTLQNVFGNKRKMLVNTPELVGMDIDEDPYVIHLK